ncbi:fumarylacetoacetate hydrolase family protein [Xanthobacter dioxanivorans]|uniref:Fumarylacetoacetate hydrolase family protein n=1 Tax=Xanthobacter dioxanivorans TaxID=2528964 RepID=A0A974PNF7_9HYPH|nr:fumarylacetoacetate hydrolase family protein [Xanthobacter dioxanivorans]QRG06531.1 fumarylacetoacetate hydrolase family protein [Xanthobacter dioxanivorans]
MVSYVFPPASVPALPVAGSADLFPVHRIYCVGRNFADHAVEMGHDPNKEPPFFFQKNPDTLVPSGATIAYPKMTADLHHEVELVVALKAGGEDIPVERALDLVFGYGVGLDLTRRDLQGEAKKLGRPWEVGKAFEDGAPCSALVPVEKIGHPASGRIFLNINGAPKQQGDLNQMIWKVPEMIATLSTLFRLAPGDLIFAGTPAGVGPIAKGDRLEGGVAGVGEITLTVA